MRDFMKITQHIKIASQAAAQKLKVSRARKKEEICDLDNCKTFLLY